MNLLLGKKAIITGGAQGIGRAVAEKYLEEGASVAIVDINLMVAKQTATELCEKYPEKCYAFYGDITKENDILNVIREVKDTFGAIDILVNNAGIQPASEPFWEISEESWDKVMKLDLKSVFLFTKAIIPTFREQGSGCVVNTASVSGLYLWNQSVPYITAKSAIIELTRAMAYELADEGIRVNAVAPGHVDTELNRKSLSEPGGRENRENQVPLRRLALPEDLAGAFAFAASEKSRHMTGATIYVDGGLTQIK